jgi:uncharacterized protein
MQTFKPITRRNRFVVAVAALLIAAAGVAVAADASAPAATTDWRAQIRQFAAEHFHHPAWGYSHSERDYALARELASRDSATLDDDVLFAAAFLHDVAAFAPWRKDKVDHADEGARIVDGILAGTGFPMAKIDAVRSAIRTHMFGRDPVGAEAVYLHDADALDWLGTVGVARILALVGSSNDDPDSAKAVKMLTDNLAQVPSRVVSPAGRARVGAREAELREFLRQLRSETDELRAL